TISAIRARIRIAGTFLAILATLSPETLPFPTAPVLAPGVVLKPFPARSYRVSPPSYSPPPNRPPILVHARRLPRRWTEDLTDRLPLRSTLWAATPKAI